MCKQEVPMLYSYRPHSDISRRSKLGSLCQGKLKTDSASNYCLSG